MMITNMWIFSCGKLIEDFSYTNTIILNLSLTAGIVGLEVNYGFTRVQQTVKFLLSFFFTIIPVVNTCKEMNEHKYVSTKKSDLQNNKPQHLQ